MTLSACETGAALVTSTPWRGDLLDRAALAAQALGRLDTPKKLEAAWLVAPSLARLLRWLLAETPNSTTIRKRVASALKACPTQAPRLVGFLHVLIGDIESSAKLLEQAPGLGWSKNGHPGHLLFPAFAWMLGGRPKGSVREGLSQALERTMQSECGYGNALLDDHGVEGDVEPKLHTPSLIEVLKATEVVERLTGPDRAVVLAAMKAAATRRTEGVLREKRRRHYNHAAALVACCVELDVVAGNAGGNESPWAEALRARTSHFPAFQAELRGLLVQAREAASASW